MRKKQETVKIIVLSFQIELERHTYGNEINISGILKEETINAFPCPFLA